MHVHVFVARQERPALGDLEVPTDEPLVARLSEIDRGPSAGVRTEAIVRVGASGRSRFGRARARVVLDASAEAPSAFTRTRKSVDELAA